MYIIYQEYELKSVPYKRKLFDLYVFQKSPYSMLLFWRYSKICNSTQIQIGQFIHLTSLFYRQWTKCIVFYANAVVQPSVQHYSCFMAWKTKVHTWCRYCHFCINASMWREKRWLQGIFDPPSYIILFQTIHYSPVHLVESVGYCGLCIRQCLAWISYAHVMYCELVITRSLCYDASAKHKIMSNCRLPSLTLSCAGYNFLLTSQGEQSGV